MRAVSSQHVAEWKMQMFMKIARDRNLTPTAVRILLYLLAIMNPGETRSVSIIELQDKLGIPGKATVSDSMKVLEKNGYLERMKSESDRRERSFKLLAVA